MRSRAEEPDVHAEVPAGVIVLVEPRILICDCLSRCLQQKHTEALILPFPALSSWRQVASRFPRPSVVILSAGDGGWTRTALEAELRSLAEWGLAAPVVVLSNEEDPRLVLEALDSGVKGFIPTSVSFDVALEAVRLVLAGGVFIPASSLMAARDSFMQPRSGRAAGHAAFTERQAEVMERIRHGKSNKVIAYELNMQESTVKVHVRTIMKKLNARNRTEVAYLAHSIVLGHVKIDSIDAEGLGNPLRSGSSDGHSDASEDRRSADSNGNLVMLQLATPPRRGVP